MQQLCLEYPNTKIPQVQQYVQDLEILQRSWESFGSYLSILFTPEEDGNYPLISNRPRIFTEFLNSMRNLQVNYRSKYK